MQKLFAFAFAAVSMLAALAPGQTFSVDPVHSVVIFRIQHLGAGQFYGRFNDPAGAFTLDAANPANIRFNLTINAAKIDTANQKRDDHLRSPDFFNTRQYPTITFKSTAVEKTGDNTLKVTGDLTLLGQTRPITADVTLSGPARDPQGTTRAGAEAMLQLKRSDFGMNFMPGALGDEVRLVVSLEGMQQ
jgi:polyisoprenoid-binding protein YceI